MGLYENLYKYLSALHGLKIKDKNNIIAEVQRRDLHIWAKRRGKHFSRFVISIPIRRNFSTAASKEFFHRHTPDTSLLPTEFTRLSPLADSQLPHPRLFVHPLDVFWIPQLHSHHFSVSFGTSIFTRPPFLFSSSTIHYPSFNKHVLVHTTPFSSILSPITSSNRIPFKNSSKNNTP